MAETTRRDLELPGCTPEPLMAYLKALGILRLVSEQEDENARGWWKNDVFWLRSTLKKGALVEFFLHQYKPTPIVVPWTGSDFFTVNPNDDQRTFSKTPTGSAAIEALLRTASDRLAPYREAVQSCLNCLNRLDFKSKRVFEGSQKDKNKSRYLRILRGVAPDVVVDWIDVTTVIGSTKVEFSAMLGSGGGSDGNTHFSDNFMQNLWEMLPDFDSQRKQQKKNRQSVPTSAISEDLLRAALFSSPTRHLVEKRTSALYDSGAVGGANATQGLRRESLSNPWNVILLFEGTLSIAGAVSKRSAADRLSLSVARRARPAFPFQFDFTPSLEDRSATKESTGREIWFPMWSRPTIHKEIANLFGEGRAEVSRHAVRNGTEMAQAAGTLGVDRGISAFRRYAVVKGRVGGENYHTASSLGVFDVREQSDTRLLAQVNNWLHRFRDACAPGRKKYEAPGRFIRALGRIDSTIFEFCKYGGATFFQEIIVALGAAERQVAGAERFRNDKKLRPLTRLSGRWLEAANDHSGELAIARALAFIHDSEQRIGPLRANLEGVDWRQHCRKWADKERCVVWNASDVRTNLANVLQRRMMDGRRAGCEYLPIASPYRVPLEVITEFIAGDLDEQRIEDLIWGLMLVDARRRNQNLCPHGVGGLDVPRAYALLKLVFLPRPLVVDQREDGTIFAYLARSNKEGGVSIRPEPSIPRLLRVGRLGEACSIAMRRLRASGLDPMPKPIRGHRVRDNDWLELNSMGSAGSDPLALAAALLLPIDDNAVSKLVRLVIRGDEIEDDRTEPVAAMNSEGEMVS